MPRSLTASAVIVMKQSDVAAKQQQEREDWQKRGIGGLVSAVDPAAGTVTISVTTFAGSKKVADPDDQENGGAALCAEFGEVRRCEAKQAGGDSSGRPVARARHQECRWNGVCRRGDRERHVPQHRGHDYGGERSGPTR